MEKAFIYDVFVSHNQKEKTWVRRFIQLLKVQGVKVFFDEDDILPGESVATGVMRGLESSGKSVLILSSESVNGRWVAAECLTILNRDPTERDLSVFLTPLQYNEIPLSIKVLMRVDLTDHPHRKNEFEYLLRTLGISAKTLPEIPSEDPETSEIFPENSNQEPYVDIDLVSLELQHRIAIIGMGYIGTSLAAALTNAGHNVIGVEQDESKRNKLSQGESHLLEPGLDSLLNKAYAAQKLSVASSFGPELVSLDLVVICVGPQNLSNRGKDAWDVTRFKRVLEEIGVALYERKFSVPLNIIIAATIRPQDCELAKKILEDSSQGSHGTDFVLATSPLFLREGSMLSDLQTPPFIITGTLDGYSNVASRLWEGALLSLVNSTERENFRSRAQCMSMGMASVVKLASNAYHAMKVCFANEIGRICKTNDIDARTVMDVFKQDKILNVSDLYLQPGFAFGGSCLSKDISGLLSIVDIHDKSKEEPFQLIESILKSNNYHIQQAKELIEYQAHSNSEVNIGFLGITFKPNTDDLRGSPVIELINSIQKRYKIYTFDPDLEKTRNLYGVNKATWVEELEDYEIKVSRNISDIISKCHVIVIAKPTIFPLEMISSLLSSRHCLIDLIGAIPTSNELQCKVYTLI